MPSRHCHPLHQLKTFLFLIVTWEPNPTVASGNLQSLVKFAQTPAHPNQGKSDLTGDVGSGEGRSCQGSFKYLGMTEAM